MNHKNTVFFDKINKIILFITGFSFVFHPVSTSYGLISICIGIVINLGYHQKNNFKTSLISNFFLLIFSLLSVSTLLKGEIITFFNQYIIRLSFLVIPFFFILYKPDNRSIYLALNSFVVSVVVFSYIALVMGFKSYLETNDHSYFIQDKLGMSFNMSALYCSFFVNTAFLFTSYLFSKGKGFSTNLYLFFGLILFFALLILLYLSRIGFLLMILNILYLIYIFSKDKNKLIQFIILISLVIGSATTMLYKNYYFHYKFRNYIEYRDKSDFNKKEDRYYIWKSAFQIVKSNPIIGLGFKSSDSLNSIYYYNEFENGIINKFNAHNQYLQYSIQFGVLFCLAFYLGVIYYIFYFRKNLLFILTAVFILLFSCIESIFERHSMNCFIVFFLILISNINISESNATSYTKS